MRTAFQRGELTVLGLAGESLDVASTIGARSIAFPAISAGVYGWDAAEVARIAWDTVAAHASDIGSVRFVLFSEDLLRAFEDARPE